MKPRKGFVEKIVRQFFVMRVDEPFFNLLIQQIDG
jgi:hypothetical protein